MKKFFKLFAVILFVVTLTACSNNKKENKNVLKLKDQTINNMTFKNIKITKDKVSKINFDITTDKSIRVNNVKIILLANKEEYLSHTIEIDSEVNDEYPIETLIENDLKEVTGIKIEVE